MGHEKINISIHKENIFIFLGFSPTLPSRKSILEMKKDHEDQVQRLKKLKDEEIDAVTSATSQTRWVNITGQSHSHFK